MPYIFSTADRRNSLAIIVTTLLLFVSWPLNLLAHDGPVPTSLKGVSVPPVPGLLDGADPIVTDKKEAIALGKALFWDMNVGTDGMSCGSCHFHAGADRRVKNQISPGEKANDDQFDPTASGSAASGPNYQLLPSDYPFHQFTDPDDRKSEVIFTTNDVTASSGSFGGNFQNAKRRGRMTDTCSHSFDSVFSVGATNTRRVEPRNTPTIFNAVFNHRNFWDGRANNIFNGSSEWGDRDPEAGVWVKVDNRTVAKERLHLINSSLASQAMAPPKSTKEMVCADRSFSALGRKLLRRHPLEHQKVAHDDSILGAYSLSSADQQKNALQTTYEKMIRKAFNQKYWSYLRRGDFGEPTVGGIPYSQMEANFSMFFGLAIQLYESTLISDDSPLDRSARSPFDEKNTLNSSLPIDLTKQELHGLALFREAHCNICHVGPTASQAAIVTNAKALENDPLVTGFLPLSTNVVARDNVAGGRALNDAGFLHTGVVDTLQDPGINSDDPFGNPLSYTAQYVQMLAGNADAVVDSAVIDNVQACNFEQPLVDPSGILDFVAFTNPDDYISEPGSTTRCVNPNWAYIPTAAAAARELADPDTAFMYTSTEGAFKVPSLRNVELTGPFMHNGSMSTLEQVLDFYNRGGNFRSLNVHAFILRAKFSEQDKADVVAFLKTFTDDRVRYERAPFDHPELRVPHGQAGDEIVAESGNPIGPILAKDEFLSIPAVGAGGRSTPLQPFHTFLPEADGGTP